MIEKLKEKYVFLILMKHYLNIDKKIDYMGVDVLSSDKLINEINNWKLFLEENIKIKINDDTPIILNIKTNKPLSDTYLRKLFNYYIEKSNVPKIRMYDLRHTFATTMMTEGWDMYVISNRLGHKRITTTINIYGNITEKVRKEMAYTTEKYY